MRRRMENRLIFLCHLYIVMEGRRRVCELINGFQFKYVVWLCRQIRIARYEVRIRVIDLSMVIHKSHAAKKSF